VGSNFKLAFGLPNLPDMVKFLSSKVNESSDLNKKKLCDKPSEIRDCINVEFGHDSHYLYIRNLLNFT